MSKSLIVYFSHNKENYFLGNISRFKKRKCSSYCGNIKRDDR